MWQDVTRDVMCLTRLCLYFEPKHCWLWRCGVNRILKLSLQQVALALSPNGPVSVSLGWFQGCLLLDQRGAAYSNGKQPVAGNHPIASIMGPLPRLTQLVGDDYVWVNYVALRGWTPEIPGEQKMQLFNTSSKKKKKKCLLFSSKFVRLITLFKCRV